MESTKTTTPWDIIPPIRLTPELDLVLAGSEHPAAVKVQVQHLHNRVKTSQASSTRTETFINPLLIPGVEDRLVCTVFEHHLLEPLHFTCNTFDVNMVLVRWVKMYHGFNLLSNPAPQSLCTSQSQQRCKSEWQWMINDNHLPLPKYSALIWPSDEKGTGRRDLGQKDYKKCMMNAIIPIFYWKSWSALTWRQEPTWDGSLQRRRQLSCKITFPLKISFVSPFASGQVTLAQNCLILTNCIRSSDFGSKLLSSNWLHLFK